MCTHSPTQLSVFIENPRTLTSSTCVDDQAKLQMQSPSTIGAAELEGRHKADQLKTFRKLLELLHEPYCVPQWLHQLTLPPMPFASPSILECHVILTF